MIDNDLCVDCEYLDYCWQSNVDAEHDPDSEECERVAASARDAMED